MLSEFNEKLREEAVDETGWRKKKKQKPESENWSATIHEGLRVNAIKRISLEFLLEDRTVTEKEAALKRFQDFLNGFLFDFEGGEFTSNKLEIKEEINDEMSQFFAVLVEYILDHVLPELGVIDEALPENLGVLGRLR